MIDLDLTAQSFTRMCGRKESLLLELGSLDPLADEDRLTFYLVADPEPISFEGHSEDDLYCMRKQHDQTTLTTHIEHLNKWIREEARPTTTVTVQMEIPCVAISDYTWYVQVHLIHRSSGSYAAYVCSTLDDSTYYFGEWGPGDTRLTLAASLQESLGEGVIGRCQIKNGHRWFDFDKLQKYQEVLASPGLPAWLAIHNGACPLCVDTTLEITTSPEAFGLEDFKPKSAPAWESKKDRAARKRLEVKAPPLPKGYSDA